MIGSMLVLLSSMMLHPAAESLAEIQWNAQTQRIEVALRLRAADEQHFIRSVSARDVESLMEDGDAFEKLAISILKRRIGFGNLPDMKKAKQSAPVAAQYHWVGRRTEGGHVWWFFEFESPEGRPSHVRCTLFEKPSPKAGQRSVSSHDHLHASPVSTFLVLPDADASKEDGDADSVNRPHSFIVTPERPVTLIEWAAA
ncbi:hypothetical protein SAMN06265222_117124 [Neorhodopirellula lusitana]|uniref:Secreted protein n=1 Tax=Neorhodopirellula lusitana TaxID=445327 RepID=A0ABY1QKR4_9BACT|nr:DUF6702 family protein [Neorhodopirellula lusitana]SMP74408.1 hypothetical protein SAMN06265222_117124 [Neorhodopirellula lusitana]